MPANVPQPAVRWREELLKMLQPEERTLLNLLSREDASPNTEPNSSCNWDDLSELIAWHRVEGVLWHRYRDELSAPLPAVVMRRLRVLAARNAAREKFLSAELKRVVAALEDASIETVLLKGAALVGTAYLQAGERPMSDLDLLVPGNKAQQAHEIVGELGYQPRGDVPEDHRHLPLLSGQNHRGIVEIHRHIVTVGGPLDFGVESLWERAVLATNEGVKARYLSAEDNLIHLCINFLLDRRYSSASALLQLNDIAMSIQSERFSPDWSRFAEIVSDHGLARPVSCALLMARGVLNADIPDAAVSADSDGVSLPVFAKSRVIARREFAAHALVSPEQPYRLGRTVLAGVGRLFFSAGGDSAGKLARFRPRLPRVGKARRLLSARAFAPSNLRADIANDRWLHSLQTREPESTRSAVD